MKSLHSHVEIDMKSLHAHVEIDMKSPHGHVEVHNTCRIAVVEVIFGSGSCENSHQVSPGMFCTRLYY